jgi:branched-chain amino acid transport system permease protein
VVQNASLTDVSFSTSGEVVLMTLVGGMGTFYGPVVGALIVISTQNYLAQFGEWVTVIQGVVTTRGRSSSWSNIASTPTIGPSS